MDYYKNLIEEAKQMVENSLYRARVKDLPQIADMVCAIQTLEEYLNETVEGFGDSEIWIINKINSELKAAEDYCLKYLETKQEAFRQMSKDEIKHAEALIKQAQEQEIEASELNPLTQKIKELQSKLG